MFASVYGGKGNEDINVHNEHIATKVKIVSLYDLMLDPFKYRGHCVVMDSTYMDDAMRQVGQAEGGINMAGTVQSSCTGGGRLGKVAIKEKYTKRKRKRAHTRRMSLSSINTTPSHYYILFGLTIILSDTF